MDWIERWFGLNPDGGDGSLETMLVVGLIVCVVLLAGALHPAVRHWLQRARVALFRGE